MHNKQRNLDEADSFAKLLTYSYANLHPWLTKDDASPFNIGKLEKMLAKSMVTEEDTLPASEDSIGRNKGSLSKAPKRIDRSSHPSPLQLLDVLSIVISSESMILSFDYVTLHIRCVKLLRDIHTICRASLIELANERHILVPADFDDDGFLCRMPS